MTQVAVLQCPLDGHSPQEASCYSPALLMLPVWLELGSATGLLRSSTQEGTDASRPGRQAGEQSEHHLTGLQRATGQLKTRWGGGGEGVLGHNTEVPPLPTGRN